MHLQASTPQWTEALVLMPDYYLLKSVQNPGILMDGYDKWVAAGRDPAKLYLDYRHHDLYLPEGDWESLKAQWRAMFFRFVDRTYLERYAPFVNLVEEQNEYFTSQSVIDEGLAKYINSARAAVAVWNGEFRGKRVTSPDGGVGTIRPDCRLILANGFVTHNIPREYYQLAIDSDNVIGYHNYTRWDNSKRASDDWYNHSGRWARMEQEYGIKPLYAFTECGPYNNAENGWKHSSVMNDNLALLESGLREVFLDMQYTAAYRENRVLGPGAFFTVGHVGWEYYQLDTPDLKVLAAMLREVWKPGADVMNKTKINQWLNEIDERTDLIRGAIQTQWYEAVPDGPISPFIKAKPLAPPYAIYNQLGASLGITRTNNVDLREKKTLSNGIFFRVIDGTIGGNQWWVRGDQFIPITGTIATAIASLTTLRE